MRSIFSISIGDSDRLCELYRRWAKKRRERETNAVEKRAAHTLPQVRSQWCETRRSATSTRTQFPSLPRPLCVLSEARRPNIWSASNLAVFFFFFLFTFVFVCILLFYLHRFCTERRNARVRARALAISLHINVDAMTTRVSFASSPLYL